MIGTPITTDITAEISENQTQDRGGQDYLRTFDPVSYQVLVGILKELKKVNNQMNLITGEEF